MERAPRRHEGRVVLVTGAGSGIGRATVERVVAEGGSAVGVDRSAASFDWVSGHPNSARISVLAGDVTDASANEHAASLAVEQFGRLDALVLNAGIPMSGDLLSMPLDQLDRVLAVNVKAVVLGIRAGVPHFTTGGSIVVTASTSGLAGAEP